MAHLSSRLILAELHRNGLIRYEVHCELSRQLPYFQVILSQLASQIELSLFLIVNMGIAVTVEHPDSQILHE